MRLLTKEKIKTVHEAKKMFNERVKKLMLAQDYELVNQEHLAVAAA